MSRALKTDIPGPDWRVGFEEARERGIPALFAGLPAPLRLVVEVGFGRGEFLLELAARDPGAAHLGVEYSHKRVLKLARRLARTELRNVRLLEAPGERVVRELLAPASVACFWINFPDPWPKARHQRRRLIAPGLVHDLALRLAPGGSLHVATDHEGYAEQIDCSLAGEPLLRNAFAPEPFRREVPGRNPTAYELEWRAEGRALHFFCYERGAPGEAEPAGRYLPSPD
jgi:tRNA (guanine-N7-)-methyltransferase